MYKWVKQLSLNPLTLRLKIYRGFSAVSRPLKGFSSHRGTVMKPVRCGCGVHTVPVAGAVSRVAGAVSEVPTRGLPVEFPRSCVEEGGWRLGVNGLSWGLVLVRAASRLREATILVLEP